MSTLEPAGGAADLADGTPGSHLEPPIGEGPVERLCKWASEAALITMLVVIGGDIFTRYLLNFSFEIADELGGYMLVVMTFVSLSVCQVNGAFHQVELVQARLSPRAARAVGRDLRRAVVRIRRASCCGTSSGSNSRPTASASALRPIWKRRSGFRGSRWRSASRRCCSRSSALSSPMCAVSAGSRMGPELQIIIVTVLFLGLLTAGMAVPFAIAVPAIIYLLMQGGFPALNGLGLMSWGSMNTFALTAVPLFMFMADILSVSGLSNRIYNGLAKLVAPLPGGLLQTNIAGCAIFASVSGSSIATAASIGGVALPQLTSPQLQPRRSRRDRSRRAARSAFSFRRASR